jgi:hypothetical protein
VDSRANANANAIANANANAIANANANANAIANAIDSPRRVGVRSRASRACVGASRRRVASARSRRRLSHWHSH